MFALEHGKGIMSSDPRKLIKSLHYMSCTAQVWTTHRVRLCLTPSSTLSAWTSRLHGRMQKPVHDLFESMCSLTMLL